MRIVVYFSIGSNIYPRVQYLRQGVYSLQSRGVQIEKISALYRTSPLHVKKQPFFLNGVIRGRTNLKPRALLDLVQAIEQECGRVRIKRFGPRVLDIDLLLYGDLVCQSKRLILPHPQMEKRKFVLVPLIEISPRLLSPDRTLYRNYLSGISASQHVSLYRRKWISL